MGADKALTGFYAPVFCGKFFSLFIRRAPMAGLIGQLIEVLNGQVENYDALLVLSERKKSAVISNDAESLQKITADENFIVGRLQRLEKNRAATMKDIGVVLNVPGDGLTLTQLCGLIQNQAEHEPLSNLVAGIKTKLDELKSINAQNKALIENSLEYINYSVNVIHSSIEQDKRFYDTSGQEIGPAGSFFDARQ